MNHKHDCYPFGKTSNFLNSKLHCIGLVVLQVNIHISVRIMFRMLSGFGLDFILEILVYLN